MNTSEQVDKIFPALIKAQSEFKAVVLDSVNPHYRSKYASFDSVWSSVKDALKANGLAVLLPLGKAEIGITVTPRVIHTSGQWLEGDASVFPVSKNDPQGVASATTYAKRIALTALLALAGDTDDDGNLASAATKSDPVEVAKRVAAKKGAGNDFGL